jgi:hypothetical protein
MHRELILLQYEDLAPEPLFADGKVPVRHSENDNHLKTHIVTCTTAKEMYDTLKQIYQRHTSQQKCLLLQDFYNFK